MFKLTALMGNRYHVSGTDSLGTEGSTVVDGEQWNDIKAYGKASKADEEFAEAVNEFFAPLIEAADRIAQENVVDDIGHVTLEEGVEHTHGKPAVVATLSKDSIVLRLIESGDTDRLLWINGDLEITEAQDELPYEAAAEAVTSGV